MATHKFAVGQAVKFSPDRDQEHATKGGLFKIVRLLPEAGDVLQYRVKARSMVTSASSEKINSHECKD